MTAGRESAIGLASPLDRISAVMSTRDRPLDFVILLHLNDAPGSDALRAGSRSAHLRFPTTSSILDRGAWSFRPDRIVPVSRAGGLASPRRAIEAFVDRPLDPEHDLPVRQLAIYPASGTRMTLVTRFHHAACDGMSALQWLSHQLDVAWGMAPPTTVAEEHRPPILRRHPRPVRRSRYAYPGPSSRLLASRKERSASRRWRSFRLEDSRLLAVVKKRGEFTHGDVLATCFLEALAEWNRELDPLTGGDVGLWYPVNIREKATQGFGNGTSRIRLYARFAGRAHFADKCRAVREQVDWCLKHGEWAIPEGHPVTTLLGLTHRAGSHPSHAVGLWERMTRPLLRRFLSRASLDMGTAVFTHLRAPSPGRASTRSRACWRDAIASVEAVGMLHARTPVSLASARHRGVDWLTLTYDPAALDEADADRCVVRIQEHMKRAGRELMA